MFIRKNKANETIAVLAARFPKCFTTEGDDRRPLKIGIKRDVFAAVPELSKYRIQEAICYYTLHYDYRAALAKGGPRIDLEGNPAGEVSEEHAALAAEQNRLSDERRAA